MRRRFQRLHIPVVRLAAGNAGRHARVGEIRPRMRHGKADAAQRQRMFRIQRCRRFPSGERRILLVHVPKNRPQVILRIGALARRLVRALRRPQEHVQFFQTAREAVIRRHRAGGGERLLHRGRVGAQFRKRIRLEVAEHRVLVAVARRKRVLERERAFRGVRLLHGGLGERGVAQFHDFFPRADAEIIADAFQELLRLESAILLRGSETVLLNHRPVFKRIAFQRFFKRSV